jgi:hypothetical protein
LTAVAAAALVYGILIQKFRQILRLLLVPAFATALVMYFSLKAYLAELIAFIPSGNPRAASLALGALTAGIFLSIFLAAVAISWLTDLVLPDRADPRSFRVRVGRPEWRLYAAYLRFLLLIAAFLTGIYCMSAYILPLLPMSAESLENLSAFLIIAGCFSLFVRVGFLIPPIVAQSTGTVLRKALHQGSRQFGRNFALLLVLSVPGFAIEIAGEYLFRLGSGPTRLEITLPIVYYARALEHRLAEFVFVSSLSAFVTLVLFTTGSIVCYRNRIYSDSPQPVPGTPIANLDSAPV